MQLSYWNCQGLAQPCRYILHAQDKEFTFSDYTPETGDKWFATDKPEMMKLTNFPNLPYLKIVDKVVTQSGAILRYLGRISGLDSKTDDQFAVSENVDGVLSDIWSSFSKLLYCDKDGYEAKKKDTHENVMKHFNLLEKHLGENTYLTGDAPIWVDFRALHIINVLRKYSSVVAGLENVSRYFNAMVNNNGDKLKAYYESQEESSVLIPGGYWQWGHAENMKSLKAEF